ncbi:MAG: NAD(P)/FAD-dependent oxidoreductase [Halobacteriovoraceae bacterium]|nr:NAD(P)/FAD-dependent oxidoreductase [Halobacteriovoraceae bacterium]MCB9093538.1 NAD(P)/FAD-dependent oxidoreductase [Halobacteriovoraceae bacterium]
MLLKKNEPVKNFYDVIVVGSGLGGMTAANKLAKNGYHVLLLEAHNKLGGFATWFYRAQRKYVFDVSLHGFPVGMKKTCRKYWNKEIADAIIPLKDIRFDNPQFQVQTDFTKEDYTRVLTSQFHLDPKKVQDFFDFIENMNFYDSQEMTNKELFEKFFLGRNDVMRFLLEPITYANGSTLEDPAISYGIVFSNFMNKGVYTFRGGTDYLIDLMKNELLHNNVDIKLQSKVEKFLINPENKQIQGIVLKDREVHCRAVISNANITSTIFKHVGEEYFSNQYIAKAKAVRLNTSSCQVYMAIKLGETIPAIGDLLFTSSAEQFNTDLLLGKNITSRTFSVYYPSTRPQDQEPRYSIVSSTNARWEDWANLDDEQYKNEKHKMIEETITALEKYIPSVREKIDFVDAATPLTIRRYTHHPRGTSFGTKFEGLEVSMNLHKEISGLFHAGSVGIIMSGWLGAANYGIIQANEVESYFFNQNELKQKENHANITC